VTNHPRRSRARLIECGARLRTVDGIQVIEMVDPNDNSQSRYQYQRHGDIILRRILSRDGSTITDWTALHSAEMAALMAMRGTYHPILDPLGF
jgi:hypothetical protein